MSATVRELPAGLDLLALKRAAPEEFPLLLESAAQGGKARWDLLLAGGESGLYLGADGVTRRESGHAVAGRFLEVLDHAQSELRDRLARIAACREGADDVLDAGAADLPYRGGWALYLGYELAAQVEPSLRLPAFRGGLPVAAALFCPAAVLRDRASGRCLAVALPGHEAWLARIANVVDGLRPAGDSLQAASALPKPPRLTEDADQRFLDGVARVHEYLRAGDVFQVNLSRGWRAGFEAAPDPVALYAALRQANPAPFAGLFALPGGSVASSSPERLVSIRGRRIETRPIAGTRPRFEGDDDAARIAELVGHPKERAEHVMLIDLERNDLGRVCAPGSVRVDELMSVESYAHVHHIVSNVSGDLRDGVTAGQAIAAVFPGGTITGCPKVRCMQIIAELEGEGRGPYTGAMGYLDAGGDMDLNILIRTLWTDGCDVAFRAGAGIVVDSRADKELMETRAKARGLLRALGYGDGA
ncbi:aminodeoxychorismate synthase component I [Silanimonas sp.]|jgi:anthranilate synthase component 1|uniref:aminodeoxychorismate synthase component I n=1 Tax=Silanimonas sp. TaxID=1929290 RepID=UPI0022CCB947|nr:aminodeoxychorismate synthase component I [Silanimonas sp.]MCZ8061450.1 aminodeoxychorismate synthase component I [Silanimonas sp.]